ncbi:MAG: 1-hydroxycarotenoid 3,4-desaturase CrtD [Myxococcota bacterium]
MTDRWDVIVVGAGIGGLCAAVELAALGRRVLICERGSELGGKMRRIRVGDRLIDSGPTVLTMRDVFDGLFSRAGASFDERVKLQPLEVLARHAWPDGSRLDLYSDLQRSANAIERMAGPREAKGFLRFSEHARRIYETVDEPFIRSDGSRLAKMAKNMGLSGLRALTTIDWHRTMWKSLRSFFRDPRLLQLFGRYATYSGSSPFQAPGTLNLIAHVEQRGVWAIEGGMTTLADALARLFVERGGEIALDASVDEVSVSKGRATGVRLASGTTLRADAVVVNANARAVVAGLLGADARRAVAPVRAPRSSSALAWSVVGRVHDFPLAYHNVVFSSDYRREFDDLGQGRIPEEPTIYVCAQDADPSAVEHAIDDREQRLFCLVNAPARGGEETFDPDFSRCRLRIFQQMSRCGLTIEAEPTKIVSTTPHDFDRRFPGAGGALYGTATHGLMGAFARPGVTTKLPGLYLVGGGVHPGAGVPMVALGGRVAAHSVHTGLGSTSRSHPAAIPGGTSMASAPMGAKPSPSSPS